MIYWVDMRYTLRQMEVFVAVGRAGNVSRAAEQLSLSQSATSTALSELERQFGQPLFDRVGRSLRLNDIGRFVLPRAVELLDRALELQDMLARQQALGPLHVGATLTIGNYLATLVVADFLQQCPASRVKLSVHNTATIAQQVANFELDFGVVEGEVGHEDLLVERWMEDELVVFARPDHPLARRGQADPQELVGEQWILREAGSGTRAALDRALFQQRLRLQVRLELEHTEAIKRAVEAGLGLGCISRLALREAFRRGSLAPIATPTLDLRREFLFLRHRHKHASAGMTALLAHFHQFTGHARSTAELKLPRSAEP